MKNIRDYTPSKYSEEKYKKVEEGIYLTLHASSRVYTEILDVELIKTLRNLDGWVEEEKSVSGSTKKIQYEGREYIMHENPYGDYWISTSKDPEEIYVTSLVFEPEPELGENKPSDKFISQYPLEDIMNKFYCWCLDSYEKENSTDSNNSYQEFASENIENIRKLRTIIGKHVYNKEENGKVKLIIE